jgi:hypothetical protein
MEQAEMDTQDKQAALASLTSDQIDKEFLPYLDRINQLPFAATKQCCVGHLEYKNPHLRLPSESTGRWGYVQLLLAQDAAEWLMTVADGWEWLWVEGSQFWLEGAEEPGMTERGSIQIAFAWDARHWPQAAEDICHALEEYQQQRCAEEVQPEGS